MDYIKFYEARDIVTEILRKDFLGPVKEDEIICDERPLDYYIIGKLYPQEDEIEVIGDFSADDCGNMDEEDAISLCNGKNPSSCGISFALNKTTESYNVQISAAKYIILDREDANKILEFKDEDYKKSATFWKRVQLEDFNKKILVKDLVPRKYKTYNIDDGLAVKVLLHKVYKDGSRTITVSLVNEKRKPSDYKGECLASYFQPVIKISSDDNNAFTDTRKNIHLNKEAEVMELEMLYSKERSYASGHGCAVEWNENENGQCTEIRSEFLPEYEVRQMMPSMEFNSDVLSMKYLSQSDVKIVKDGLTQLLDKYKEWINKRRQDALRLPEEYRYIADENLNKCEETLIVLQKSVECFKNQTVYKAFQLANKAMFLQRKQSLINNNKFEKDELIRWYPFQLAFMLQEVVSFAKPDGPERKDVDLLWFPTGGGKTEAYLGIAAFCIFLRRFKNGKDGDGVAILMRYTLRLLSFQQFERAAALVCACEVIRREEKILGGEIGIGLWAGRDLTPNKIEMAQTILNGGTDPDYPGSNPAQLGKCPWCYEKLTKENYHCDIKQHRMLIKCTNPKCHFKDGLPVYLVDEEIYWHKPTYVIATVDKFAQIALNAETSSIFGIDSVKLPPELIIQDELHLISGPLGTITGLYEAGITKLCETNGHKPKIVASTATIRNAKDQIKALYASEYTQFPPQGIDINDSFFAVLSKRSEKPARKYMGCMAIGTSSTTMFIRVMASLLYATRYLAEIGYSDEIVDAFWTITGYFNSLRELGGAIIRVEDDIQDRFSYLRNNKFKTDYPLTEKSQYRYDRYKELTSREKSEDIGNIIQNDLQEKYTSDGSTAPYDVLLASNMISVGVDVGRLGTMLVVGQPKATSEYIQATSRVGRENPGLVITTYNQAKSRDRSHYEQFLQYHKSFYKFVEATSVTPFADRARDRALQTLYVILCRYTIPELRGDADAINYKRDIPELENIRNYICGYVNIVDPDELENVKSEIESIEEEWENRVYRREKLKYRNTKFTRVGETLFDDDFEEASRFRVLNTMRSVETTVNVITKE